MGQTTREFIVWVHGLRELLWETGEGRRLCSTIINSFIQSLFIIFSMQSLHHSGPFLVYM